MFKFPVKYHFLLVSFFIFFTTFILEPMEPPPATNGPVVAGYFANWYFFLLSNIFNNTNIIGAFMTENTM
jgi:hypothetical protein